MDQKKPSVFERIENFLHKCWCVFIIPSSTFAGAYMGLQMHDIGGAIGLGLAGLIIGTFFAFVPSIAWYLIEALGH
ncbi:hypothetical protein [Agrobacterium sp.]|uniref:hypothetical protein n=1 Tax=Agrobacterium sp. TaxID=361 RepID=UPI0028A97453|nr:hypothetical protein [Agrobacterium sp.]